MLPVSHPRPPGWGAFCYQQVPVVVARKELPMLANVFHVLFLQMPLVAVALKAEIWRQKRGARRRSLASKMSILFSSTNLLHMFGCYFFLFFPFSPSSTTP